MAQVIPSLLIAGWRSREMAASMVFYRVKRLVTILFQSDRIVAECDIRVRPSGWGSGLAPLAL